MNPIERALWKVINSEQFEKKLGDICLKAMNQAFIREIEIESGRDNPGGPPVIRKEVLDVLNLLVKNLSYTEGAIRGCQKDAASARNASVGVVNALTEHLRALEPVLRRIDLCDPEVIEIAETTSKEN